MMEKYSEHPTDLAFREEWWLKANHPIGETVRIGTANVNAKNQTAMYAVAVCNIEVEGKTETFLVNSVLFEEIKQCTDKDRLSRFLGVKHGPFTTSVVVTRLNELYANEEA